jgi:hypothetical protein
MTLVQGYECGKDDQQKECHVMNEGFHDKDQVEHKNILYETQVYA